MPGQKQCDACRVALQLRSVANLTGVDRCKWFDACGAQQKINPAQAELIDRLEASLSRDRPR